MVINLPDGVSVNQLFVVSYVGVTCSNEVYELCSHWNVE